MDNFLTIDVEDYFHVSAFETIVTKEQWPAYECRVVSNTTKVLDLLDRHGVKATFFVLGWVAEHYPDLVAEIDRRGHEIGCHSYYHRLVYDMTPHQFKEDTARAKDVLEQLLGKRVRGYRAPSYSITQKSLWAYDILEELGFEYDSSVFPIHHDRYGIPGAPRFPYRVPGHTLQEYPLSTAPIYGNHIPVSGGGYFRLFPYWFIKGALKRINKEEGRSFMFYFHPWEIDPFQPKIRTKNILSRFRHYVNLSRTLPRLDLLLQDFRFRGIS